jgi:twitching motility protein PilT
MIREGKTFQIPSVMQSGQSVGMQTMDMALERLLAQAKINPEDALDVATDKEAMARIVARTRPDLVEVLS